METTTSNEGRPELPDDIATAAGTARQRRQQEPEAGTPKEAVEKAREGKRLSPEEASDATAYFLDALDSDDGGPNRISFELHTGARWVPWTVQALPRERIAAIRKAATPSRARAGGRTPGPMDVDQDQMSLLLAAEGTVSPDIGAYQAKLAVKLGNPVDLPAALEHMLREKPMLIEQISTRVLDASGAADEDVRDPLPSGR